MVVDRGKGRSEIFYRRHKWMNPYCKNLLFQHPVSALHQPLGLWKRSRTIKAYQSHNKIKYKVQFSVISVIYMSLKSLNKKNYCIFTFSTYTNFTANWNWTSRYNSTQCLNMVKLLSNHTFTFDDKFILFTISVFAVRIYTLVF